MAHTCKNPACDDRSWWAGFCRLCFQTTGAADQFAEERIAEERAVREAREQAEKDRVAGQLLRLGDEGLLPWWEVSERLNAAGLKWDGKRFTPAIARGRYLQLTAHEWEQSG
ncbi:MAG: hypothetical protein GY708_26310 [Actinomycetia bacterium]|nr:hypothetical protein [Actinomycetes bacterium]MCP4961788.1 hypothetical protein [Actinomycetes bacterium]